MARFFLVIATLLASAAAFSAPRTSVARPAAAKPAAAAPAFDANLKAVGIPIAGALTVCGPAAANAFTAAYLPAILVPVMTLFMPVMAMGLFTILVSKEDL